MIYVFTRASVPLVLCPLPLWMSVVLHLWGDTLSLESYCITWLSIGFEILEKHKAGWRQLEVPVFLCVHVIHSYTKKLEKVLASLILRAKGYNGHMEVLLENCCFDVMPYKEFRQSCLWSATVVYHGRLAHCNYAQDFSDAGMEKIPVSCSKICIKGRWTMEMKCWM